MMLVLSIWAVVGFMVFDGYSKEHDVSKVKLRQLIMVSVVCGPFVWVINFMVLIVGIVHKILK